MNYILYTSPQQEVAKFYAGVSPSQGWIREYVLIHDINIPNISRDKTQWEVTDESWRQMKVQNIDDCDGYYLKWAENSEELAIRNPMKHLQLIWAKCYHGIFDSNGNKIAEFQQSDKNDRQQSDKNDRQQSDKNDRQQSDKKGGGPKKLNKKHKNK